MSLIGQRTATIARHDTNEVESGSHGFVPNADGVLTYQAENDGSDQTMQVLGGVFYPIRLKLFKVASVPTAVTLVFARSMP